MAHDPFEGEIIVPIDRGRQTGLGLVFGYVDREVSPEDYLDVARRNAKITRAALGNKAPRFLASVLATRRNLLMFINPGPLRGSDRDRLYAAVAGRLRGRPPRGVSATNWALLADQFRDKLPAEGLQPVMWHGKTVEFRTHPAFPRPERCKSRGDRLARDLCREIDAGATGLPGVEPEVFARRVRWWSHGLPQTPFEVAIYKNPSLARQMLEAGAAPRGEPVSSAAVLLHVAEAGAGSLELFGRLLELGFDPDGPAEPYEPSFEADPYHRSLLARLLDQGPQMLPFVGRLFVHPGFDRRVWPERRGAPLPADEYAWWQMEDEVFEALRGWARWDGESPTRRAWVGAVLRAANAKT